AGGGRQAAKISLSKVSVEHCREARAGRREELRRGKEQVVGPVGMALELLKGAFGDWHPASSQPATPAPVPVSDIPEQVQPQLLLIDKPGSTQANVAMMELGVTLDDPDIFALDVLNSLLNGFGGRLFDQVRSRDGLAYSVYGGFQAALDHPGVFSAGGQTAAPDKLVAGIRKVLADTTEIAPSSKELEQAKESALNSFVFNFSSNGAQLSRIISYDAFGIDQNFIFEYRAGIQRVTAQDVLGAAKRHLHPFDQQVIVYTLPRAHAPAVSCVLVAVWKLGYCLSKK
ncbi:hypothetical protein CYMTET_31641, partial [Cymbomonas tetramitiformis]